MTATPRKMSNEIIIIETINPSFSKLYNVSKERYEWSGIQVAEINSDN